MEIDALKIHLTELLPSITFEEGGEWLTINVEPNDWKPFAEKLKATDALYFDYLFCLTCVDWKTHLTMVYHLSSTKHRHTIVVKSKLDRTTPVIETVCDIWRTAEFHEREVSEMFGYSFYALAEGMDSETEIYMTPEQADELGVSWRNIKTEE